MRSKWALVIGTILSGAVASIASISPKLILSMFIHHEPVLAIEVEYLRIVAPRYFVFALMFGTAGAHADFALDRTGSSGLVHVPLYCCTCKTIALQWRRDWL